MTGIGKNEMYIIQIAIPSLEKIFMAKKRELLFDLKYC